MQLNRAIQPDAPKRQTQPRAWRGPRAGAGPLAGHGHAVHPSFAKADPTQQARGVHRHWLGLRLAQVTKLPSNPSRTEFQSAAIVLRKRESGLQVLPLANLAHHRRLQRGQSPPDIASEILATRSHAERHARPQIDHRPRHPWPMARPLATNRLALQHSLGALPPFPDDSPRTMRRSPLDAPGRAHRRSIGQAIDREAWARAESRGLTSSRTTRPVSRPIALGYPSFAVPFRPASSCPPGQARSRTIVP